MQQIRQQIIDRLQEQLTKQLNNQPTQSVQHEVINTRLPPTKLPKNENYFSDKYNITKIIVESL